MHRKHAVCATMIALTSFGSRTLGQQVTDPKLMIESVATGFANPTGMTFVGPDRFLVGEQNTGKVKVVINGAVQATLALDLPVPSGLEPGLLSMVKHPDFPASP